MKKRQLIMAQLGVLLLIVAIIWIKITTHFDATGSPDILVNVNEYGAIGDGVHDNTKAFQTAIDDVFQQGGGTVFVPAGMYNLNPIYLKKNVHLLGEQRDTVILKLADDAPDDYTRIITTADDTSIQSITCDGNYQNHPNGIEHMHCIFIDDNENVSIKNNKIINAVGDGISVTGSSKTSKNITIENNIVKENQRSQIVIEQVNHLQVTNNVIESKTGRPALHFEPWEEQQYEDATISMNKIESNVNGNCVLLAGADSEQAEKDEPGYFFNHIKFYQNEVHCPKGALLLMDTSNANVFDNQLTVKEIHVWRKNQQVRIEGNHINANIGIRIEGGKDGKLISTGTVIIGNAINTENDGVNIHAGGNETYISNNHFTGSNKASGVALFASDDITNTVITDNTFLHYQTGVFLDYDYYAATKIERVRITSNLFFISKNKAVVQTNHNRRLIKELVISNNQYY
ncbi:hypothetical protein HHO41_11180 [Bacillus sp. DNRA2]|uniref:right-handed parallel beta-helix repeat-containing protein n=1 Tax=Bacillus sp. DNRA2 TaxID=2723053 RepID=UPI00145CC80F|nr:right-handed parallel beta-helix repeat-containing protein [Bacillus sp. DNRA2]NMD70856.1 hypothetical protein [Bacillus sp. DNRA2]